jgi:ankyrin repeat protein
MTPLHNFLDDDYDESKHFDSFQVLLGATNKKDLRAKDAIGHIPLSLACLRDSPGAPKTVLALLQACPATASMKAGDERVFPIYFYFNAGLSSPDDAVGIAFEALLKANKKSASEKDENGSHLLHKVARYGSLDVVKSVYEAYPEAIKHCNLDENDPLHLAALGRSVETVQYLYSMCPEAAERIIGDLDTLLHYAAWSGSFNILKLVYGYSKPGDIRQATLDTGYLPLHETAANFALELGINSNHEDAEKLRFLLKHYPEAASVSDIDGFTPYDLLPKTDTEVAQRLLLRAAPEANPSELHRLNYEARCGALYLLFAAELPESGLSRMMNPTDQTSASATTIMTTCPRRSARRMAAEVKAETIAPSQSAASRKIWRLLKGRADTMLWKEIVLFL